MSIANHYTLVGLLMLEHAKHATLWFFKLFHTFALTPSWNVTKINKLEVNKNPLIRLIGYSYSVFLWHAWKWWTVSLTIAYAETQFLQLCIIEIVNMIDLLQAEQTGFTRSNFFNDSGTTEVEFQFRGSSVGEVLGITQCISQQIVAHDMDLAFRTLTLSHLFIRVNICSAHLTHITHWNWIIFWK